jgi:hypothetical protein
MANALEILRDQLRAMRLFIHGVADQRLNDVDSLLSVAETEIERVHQQNELDPAGRIVSEKGKFEN